MPMIRNLGLIEQINRPGWHHQGQILPVFETITRQPACDFASSTAAHPRCRAAIDDQLPQITPMRVDQLL